MTRCALEKPWKYANVTILLSAAVFPIALLLTSYMHALLAALIGCVLITILSEIIWQRAYKSGILIMTEESHPELHKLMVEADAEYIAGQIEKL
jgi:uncharacterized membrane-anchored protein YitT (DUF2179 family)